MTNKECVKLFDFLKKKFNKTIKDVSESTEEEMTKHDEEFAKDLDDLEEAFSSIEEKYSKDESKEEDKEEEPDSATTEDEVEDTQEESKDTQEEIPEEDEEEKIEKTEETKEETIEEKTEEIEESEEKTESDGEEESSVEEEPTEDKKKGRFSFFRRNKKEDKKEEVSTTEKVEEVVDETPDIEESKEEDTTVESQPEEEVEDKKEKKGRFSFFRRDKKEDKKEEKTEEETESSEVAEEKEKEEEAPKEEKSGGMFSFITQKTITEDDIGDILDELFMSLLEGDVAYEVADRIVESVKEDLIGKKIKRRGDMELFTTNALKNAITEIIDNGSYDLLGNIEEAKNNGEPYKIMFVGINGTGKTTTIAKLARYLEKHGYSSVLGASDTFRAGAIEQLEHHAENLNLKIIKHERNSDPAAVAYDAVDHAKATGKDVVLIDTSGRMQTNVNLMDEMKKIKRVSEPDCIMYVGDALMGNDATEQATKFNDVIDIDAIILTKADADAKGGAALSIGHVIHKPILFVGTGQSYDDLMEFKPEWMINLIFEE